ncbi:putative transcriptional regulatory protein [Colletotrichum fructicola]|nr:putative transcriptional regulatory protein [Colletotrichum fructicola]KAF4936296.1 putative transcriptional regulatory protein [Colletotrichum fructicola]
MDVGGPSPSQHPLSDSGATSHLFSTSAHVLPFAKSSLSLANGKVPNIEALTRRSENTASLQRTVFPSMYIRKNESRGHYVGLGSVGATLAICLTDGLKSQQLPLKSDGLDFLIEAGPQVDEAGLSSLFDITSQELPSKEAATKCIQAFFECVAFFFPIIDRDIFMSRMEMMYTPQRPRLNALDYCLFHLVVSLGALVQRRTSTQTEDMDRIYLSSYQKAWTMMSDALTSPCETSLQILILHIFIHTKSGREGFAWVLCGLAIRVAQSLGLHQKSPTDMGFSERRIILRSRLWCILFGFDS